MLVMPIIMDRHRNRSLLLNELGGYLFCLERCSAGVKQISNLMLHEMERQLSSRPSSGSVRERVNWL